MGECKVSLQLAHDIPTLATARLGRLATNGPNAADFLCAS